MSRPGRVAVVAKDRGCVILVLGGDRASLVGLTTAFFAGAHGRPPISANDAGMQDVIFAERRITVLVGAGVSGVVPAVVPRSSADVPF